jgi:hypothetical protein
VCLSDGLMLAKVAAVGCLHLQHLYDQFSKGYLKSEFCRLSWILEVKCTFDVRAASVGVAGCRDKLSVHESLRRRTLHSLDAVRTATPLIHLSQAVVAHIVQSDGRRLTDR